MQPKMQHPYVDIEIVYGARQYNTVILFPTKPKLWIPRFRNYLRTQRILVVVQEKILYHLNVKESVSSRYRTDPWRGWGGITNPYLRPPGCTVLHSQLETAYSLYQWQVITTGSKEVLLYYLNYKTIRQENMFSQSPIYTTMQSLSDYIIILP